MEKVLVVEDEVEVCDALKIFLSLKKYEVETALDGPTALKKIENFRPHMVLLDIKMPGMTGIDVLKEIRKVNPEIGIIMVTAIFDKKTVNKAIQLGAYDYIKKPINLTHLETVLIEYRYSRLSIYSSETTSNTFRKLPDSSIFEVRI